MSATHHSLVAVSGNSHREKMLNALMADVNEYDTIFVESIEHGYSRIKQVTPDLVLVCSEIDDVAACQLLSLLKFDDDLWRIPVVTYSTRPSGSEYDAVVPEPVGESTSVAHAIRLN